METRPSPTKIADNRHAALRRLAALAPPLTRYEHQGPVISGATLATGGQAALPSGRPRFGRETSLTIPYRLTFPPVKEPRVAGEIRRMKRSPTRQATRLARDAHAMVERQTRLLHRLSQLPHGETYPFDFHVKWMGDALRCRPRRTLQLSAIQPPRVSGGSSSSSPSLAAGDQATCRRGNLWQRDLPGIHRRPRVAAWKELPKLSDGLRQCRNLKPGQVHTSDEFLGERISCSRGSSWLRRNRSGTAR